jgi:integrase
MARGSIQLRHRKYCPSGAWGDDPRACRCGPTVYTVVEGQFARVGYLPERWKRADLDPFERRLIEHRDKLEAGESYKPRKVVKLADYATGWFDELHSAAEAQRISKLTYNSYESIWSNHLDKAFGGTPLAAIDAGMIRRYVASKLADGYAPRTVNASLTPLSAMLTDAVAEGLIASNPARQPRRGRHAASRRTAVYAEEQAKVPKFLEPVEARALLAATPDGYRDMVLAALTTGFRRGELFGLRWEDVRWGEKRIDLNHQLQSREMVGCKYASEREVPLYSGLATVLGKRRQAEGYIFLGPDGRPWNNAQPAEEFLTESYKTAGLHRPGHLWHVLRHTYASALAAGGVRRDVVEVLMGHRSRGTTSIYTHLFGDAFEGVEEALDAAFGVNVTSTDGSVTTAIDGSSPMADMAVTPVVAASP